MTLPVSAIIVFAVIGLPLFCVLGAIGLVGLHHGGTPLSGASLGIDVHWLAWLLVATCACYIVALALADAIDARVAIGAIVALHVLFLIAPPLISSDVFGYIDAARLGTLHGINPYSPASTHLPHDPVHLYRRWATDLPSPYGPLFVVASYALVPLGIAGALWALKTITAAASLAVVWLVWKCAERLGRERARGHRAARDRAAGAARGTAGAPHGCWRAPPAYWRAPHGRVRVCPGAL